MKWNVILLLLLICSSPITGFSQISEPMKSLIKEMEGLSTIAYLDGEEVAVGYGHHVSYTEYEWIRNITPGEEISVELADLLFEYDMLYLVAPGLLAVRKDIGYHYPANVYDVMGSIIYNIGLAGLRRSEFYRLFRSGKYNDAFLELLMLKSRDKGVYNRRKKELRVLLKNFDTVAGCYTSG